MLKTISCSRSSFREE
jgi:hypothetical protein